MFRLLNMRIDSEGGLMKTVDFYFTGGNRIEYRQSLMGHHTFDTMVEEIFC